MDQRKLVIIGSVTLLLLAGLLRWYTDYAVSQPSPNLSSTPLPDTIVLNLEQLNFNDAGQLTYKLHAKQARHFEKQATAEFTDLSLIIFNNGKAEWHVHANAGLTTNNAEIIELSGDVSIQQDSKSHKEPIQLNTAKLLFSPKKEYAETREPVIIQQGTSVTHATGMKVNIRAGEITLLSNVKSRYEITP
ncbi:MAG: LPS export ABC transporter periplasmic protein LptC [Moraxellaceae bacterium]|nr:MAG: LPS export ABC transporter periplasmic protein LptC [Moraxellaceae bacterium]